MPAVSSERVAVLDFEGHQPQLSAVTKRAMSIAFATNDSGDNHSFFILHMRKNKQLRHRAF